MATIKTWGVTTSRLVEDGATVKSVDEENVVEAHQITLEPSGALSFWAVTHDGMQAILMFAFGVGEWKRVAIRPNAPAANPMGEPSR